MSFKTFGKIACLIPKGIKQFCMLVNLADVLHFIFVSYVGSVHINTIITESHLSMFHLKKIISAVQFTA